MVRVGIQVFENFAFEIDIVAFNKHFWISWTTRMSQILNRASVLLTEILNRRIAKKLKFYKLLGTNIIILNLDVSSISSEINTFGPRIVFQLIPLKVELRQLEEGLKNIICLVRFCGVKTLRIYPHKFSTNNIVL